MVVIWDGAGFTPYEDPRRLQISLATPLLVCLIRLVDMCARRPCVCCVEVSLRHRLRGRPPAILQVGPVRSIPTGQYDQAMIEIPGRSHLGPTYHGRA